MLVLVVIVAYVYIRIIVTVLLSILVSVSIFFYVSFVASAQLLVIVFNVTVNDVFGVTEVSPAEVVKDVLRGDVLVARGPATLLRYFYKKYNVLHTFIYI